MASCLIRSSRIREASSSAGMFVICVSPVGVNVPEQAGRRMPLLPTDGSGFFSDARQGSVGSVIR